jgi:hypothetical protein
MRAAASLGHRFILGYVVRTDFPRDPALDSAGRGQYVAHLPKHR